MQVIKPPVPNAQSCDSLKELIFPAGTDLKAMRAVLKDAVSPAVRICTVDKIADTHAQVEQDA